MMKGLCVLRVGIFARFLRTCARLLHSGASPPRLPQKKRDLVPGKIISSVRDAHFPDVGVPPTPSYVTIVHLNT